MSDDNIFELVAKASILAKSMSSSGSLGSVNRSVNGIVVESCDEDKEDNEFFKAVNPLSTTQEKALIKMNASDKSPPVEI